MIYVALYLVGVYNKIFTLFGVVTILLLIAIPVMYAVYLFTKSDYDGFVEKGRPRDYWWYGEAMVHEHINKILTTRWFRGFAICVFVVTAILPSPKIVYAMVGIKASTELVEQIEQTETGKKSLEVLNSLLDKTHKDLMESSNK